MGKNKDPIWKEYGAPVTAGDAKTQGAVQPLPYMGHCRRWADASPLPRLHQAAMWDRFHAAQPASAQARVRKHRRIRKDQAVVFLVATDPCLPEYPEQRGGRRAGRAVRQVRSAQRHSIIPARQRVLPRLPQED